MSRDEDDRLRGIEVQRLKDKLGTRQVPTAELLLDGLPAHRVGQAQLTVFQVRLCAVEISLTFVYILSSGKCGNECCD